MVLEKVYDELISMIEDLRKQINAGSGGVSDYDELENRPKVNNITLTGNKRSSDLKIAYSMTEAEYTAASKNAESIYCLQENAAEVTETDDLINIEWTQSGDDYFATVSYTPSNQDVTGVTSVTCDADEITIEEFRLADGTVVTTISTTDPAEVPESVEFTYTMTQPIGATRIVKDGVEFGKHSVSYTETSLYTGTTDVSSYELSQALTNFDEIVCMATYTTGQNTYQLVNTFPVSWLDADKGSGLRYGLCSDEGYVYFTVTDTTHFAKAQNSHFFINKILGVKY